MRAEVVAVAEAVGRVRGWVAMGDGEAATAAMVAVVAAAAVAVAVST